MKEKSIAILMTQLFDKDLKLTPYDAFLSIL